MRVKEISWGKAPKDGYVLACFRQEVLFQKLDEEIKQKVLKQQKTLLELHVFDREREYRLIRCEAGDFIEAVVDDRAADEKKIETVQVEGRFEKLMRYLQVVNYIDYDENGMLSINNYRLAPVEGGR